MDPEILPEKINYGCVELSTAQDIYNHSGLVQKSLSPLNLRMCEEKYLQIDHHEYPHLRRRINSEQRCSRHPFYCLNLDMPREMKESFKMRMEFDSQNSELFCCLKVCIAYGFYPNLISKFLKYACKDAEKKYRILKWVLNFTPFLKYEIPYWMINYFADCMNSEMNDSEFVIKCFQQLNFVGWMMMDEKPEKLEKVLYYSNRLNWNLEDLFGSNDLIRICIERSLFQDLKIALKFIDAQIYIRLRD
ncbi:hypothetical protein HNY73_000685 [Argiope bruennichi]|uniref:Uncharacterized protein n=1 Tax=Argiope bruennichi TaxID=94029 RepID=A0A8T0G4X0_ARGBR|nr:hypothetical protein HNY73_000685 [Argiope bruennichi]